MSRRDAEAATWISPSEGSATRAAVEAAWADIGITPSHRLELPSWEAVKLAVARGHGVAGCSQFTVDGELRAGTLGLVRRRGWKVRRMISIVRHRDTMLTPSAREFVANFADPTEARYERMSERDEIARERELQKDYERIWLPAPVKHSPGADRNRVDCDADRSASALHRPPWPRA